ncbi:MAG: hypothetical protein AAGB32_01550 [Pseudomonadota bacterium]
MKPEDPKQFNQATDVTSDLFQKRWDSEDLSSLNTTIEGLNDKLRQTRGSVIGGIFKVGVGAPIKAMASLTPQRDQQALQPVAAAAEIGMGIVSTFSNMAEGIRTYNRINSKRSSLLSSTTASRPEGAAPGGPISGASGGPI